MQLRLKYPATPEHAADHARLAVESVLRVKGWELDYSSESLAILDQVLEDMCQEGIEEALIAETLFTLGCYVGEVFVRQARGIWRNEDETPLRGLGGYLLVVELPTEGFCNPIAKVFKRFRNGEVDSLSYFYAVFAKKSSRTEDSPS